MSWAPSGLVSGSGSPPSRIRSTHGATFASTRRACTVCDRVPSCQVTSAPSSEAEIELTPAPVTTSAPARVGRGEQAVGHRAHAAHRHPPLAGAVADQVVEEARGSGPATARSCRRRCRSARRWRPRRARCRRGSGARWPHPAARARSRATRRGPPATPPATRSAAGRAASARPRRPAPRRRRRTPATRRTRRRRRSARGTTPGWPRPRAARRAGRRPGRHGRTACRSSCVRERSSTSSSRSFISASGISETR